MLLFALALAGTGLTQAATLEGTATYRERMMLPPSAVFEATLQDVSKTGAAPKTLGRAILDPAGQPPFRFAIDYDAAAIQPDGHYVVNAMVSVPGRMLFVALARHLEFTGTTAPVQLLLVRAQSNRFSIFAKQLPASYEREVPGADSLVRWHLDLLPGGQYQLRTTYVDKPTLKPIDRIGRWQYDSALGVLKLFQSDRSTLLFDVEDAGGLLRPLDARGKLATSPYNVPLRRLPRLALVEPELKLTGMFSYMADAASITLCEDGRRMPVAMEGDFKALERAYVDAPHKSGQALYVRLDGRIASRPSAEESQPPRATLVVEKFTDIQPGLSCGMVATHIALRGTYWKLVQLNGQAISLPGAVRKQEPHLVFSAKGDRVSGAGGCNAVTGSFKVDGDKLHLRQMVSTLRACLTGMEYEREFLQTLGKVERYRIVGGHLDLLDEKGAVIARFEAVALR
ncbi:MAG: META domain-containing protein [Gammaproteobacteria bacterium]|nr:META domain-containing protein [Gammaproteobacteria bacterium]